MEQNVPSEERQAKHRVFDLLASGRMNMAEVALVSGVGRSTILRWCREWGLNTRRLHYDWMLRQWEGTRAPFEKVRVTKGDLRRRADRAHEEWSNR